MVKRYVYKDTTWIDITKPKSDDVKAILDEFDIHHVIGEELMSPTLRSKVDVYPTYIYLILHLPHGSSGKPQEIDFIIGKHFIITTRYEELDPVLEFSKTFEVESVLDRSRLGDHAGFIFFFMMRVLYHSLMERLDIVEKQIQKIENHIFKGEEREMVTELGKVSRLMLNFKNAVDNHETMLESLEIPGKAIFGEDFSHYIHNIQGEGKRVRNSIATKRSYISELRDTNDSLLTTKQNETMKIFTILAFVTFPIALIVEILGIPSDYNPILGSPHDFWKIVLVTVLIMVVMVIYFKKKKWL